MKPIRLGELVTVATDHVIAMPEPVTKVPSRLAKNMILVGKGNTIVCLEPSKEYEVATGNVQTFWRVLTPHGLGWILEDRIKSCCIW